MPALLYRADARRSRWQRSCPLEFGGPRGKTVPRHPAIPSPARAAAGARKTRSCRYVSVRGKNRDAPSIEEARPPPLRADGAALRAEPMGGPVRLPGAGRGREGQRDQARDARARSEIDAGLQLQGAVNRGTEARFHVALHEVAS